MELLDLAAEDRLRDASSQFLRVDTIAQCERLIIDCYLNRHAPTLAHAFDYGNVC